MEAAKSGAVPSAKDEAHKAQLEWVQMKQDLTSRYGENAQERFYRKFSSNPFVPIGCLTTVGILGYGLYNFRQGKTRMSQKMMRWRIIAQGLTIVAIGVGVVVSSGGD